MVNQFIPGKKVNMESETSVSAYRFILPTGTHCGAGERAYGVSMTAKVEDFAFPVIITGEALVELGASATAGAEVESDADGCAITLASGKCNGVLRDSGGSGDVVRIKVV